MQEFISSRRDIDESPGTECATTRSTPTSTPSRGRTRPTAGSLDPADRDDLRRPRHPRRLEHLAGVEGRHGGHRLVARAGGGRAGVVLGLPAPGQHDLGRAGGRPDGVSDQRARGGRRGPTCRRGPRRARRPRRPGPDVLPLELCPAEFGTQARLVVVDSRAARVLHPERTKLPRRGGDVLARCAAAGRRRPPVGRHVPAVPAGPGPALRRVLQRGSRPGPGATARPGSARRCGAAPTSSTGRPSSRRSEGARRPSRWPTTRGRAPQHDHLPVRRCAPQLCRRGHGRRASGCAGGGGESDPASWCSPIRNPLSRRWRFATAAAVVRRGRPGRPRRRPVGEGAGRAAALAPGARDRGSTTTSRPSR